VSGELVLPQSLTAAADLVWDSMRCEERSGGLHSTRTSVLMITGPCGSGKNQVLYRLRDKLAEIYPCAYLDGEWPVDSTWEMPLDIGADKSPGPMR
jgi:hypothetical protein